MGSGDFRRMAVPLGDIALITAASASGCFLNICDLLEFTKQVGVMFCEMTDNANVPEETSNVSRRED